MRIGSWFLAFLLGGAILAPPAPANAGAAESDDAPTVRWTIQKIKVLGGRPWLFATGSNMQYFKLLVAGRAGELKCYHLTGKCWQYAGKLFESPPDSKEHRAIVPDLKYHFWVEEHWQLKQKRFDSKTFLAGMRAIVGERANNQSIDVIANILAVACLTRDNRYQEGEYALKSEHFADNFSLGDMLMAKLVARLNVISGGRLTVVPATEADKYVMLPEKGTAYAKLALIDKRGRERWAFLVRSDNSPTVQFGFVR